VKLDLNKTRILGYYGQGSKFFDREILDGIVTKPGGAHILMMILMMIYRIPKG
jgi:hypothetical protein